MSTGVSGSGASCHSCSRRALLYHSIAFWVKPARTGSEACWCSAPAAGRGRKRRCRPAAVAMVATLRFSDCKRTTGKSGEREVQPWIRVSYGCSTAPARLFPHPGSLADHAFQPRHFVAASSDGRVPRADPRGRHLLLAQFRPPGLGQSARGVDMSARTFALLVGISMRCAWLTPAGPAVVTILAVATKGCSA